MSPQEAVLLVEGTNDEHVVKNLCGIHKLGSIGEVKNCGGKEKLLEHLPVRIKASGLKTLGIIIDADEDASATWDSIESRLVISGYDIPDRTHTRGTIISPPKTSPLLPKIGFWIMPDNRTPGATHDSSQVSER